MPSKDNQPEEKSLEPGPHPKLPEHPPVVATVAIKLESLWRALRNLSSLPEATGVSANAKSIRLGALVSALASYFQTRGIQTSDGEGEIEYLDPFLRFPSGVHRRVMEHTAKFSDGEVGPLLNASASLAVEAVGLQVLSRLSQLNVTSASLPLPLNLKNPPASIGSGVPPKFVTDGSRAVATDFGTEVFFDCEKLRHAVDPALRWITANLPTDSLLSWLGLLQSEIDGVAKKYASLYDTIYDEDGTFTVHAAVMLISFELVMRRKEHGDWVSGKNWSVVAPNVLEAWSTPAPGGRMGMKKTKGTPILTALHSCDLAEPNAGGRGSRLTRSGLNAADELRGTLSQNILASIEELAKLTGAVD